MQSNEQSEASFPEYRLHKTSPIFILFDNIKKLIVPALFAIVSSRGNYWEHIALGVAALVSVGSMVQYRFYRYWLEEKQIRIKEGILFRNVRQVPYNKIQNLNLIQNPLHRILGVVKVQLESASGGKPEAVINVIDKASVEELRKKIHQDDIQSTPSDVTAEQPKGQAAILKLNLAEIFRYGIISNRGLVAVAIGFGFFSQFLDNAKDNFYRNIIGNFVNQVESSIDAVTVANSLVSNILLSIVFFIIAVISLWLLSIGMALFKLHEFELVEKNKKLSATMGLLTRLQATIPMSRIQSLTVHNSLLHRLFKRIGVSVETAGGVNTEQQGVTMKQLAPVLPITEKIHFLKQVQDDVDWLAVHWKPIEARAWKRMFKLSVFIWMLVLLPTSMFSIYWYLTLGVLAAVWSFFYAKLYVKNTGYYLAKDVIAFKSGVVFKKETYVRLPKVQTVDVTENLFDRRHKMAVLRVDTAGAAAGAHHIEIPYINLQDALTLQATLIKQVKNIEFQW